jgi:hypothetical protein
MRPSRAFGVCAVHWALLTGAACDPNEDAPVGQNGPPFLIVAPAAEQPTPPDQGTTIYVQARGGDYIGLFTSEGKHRYNSLGNDYITSCARLPGSEPLYLLVKPNDQETMVEARLFYVCGDVAFAVSTLADCQAAGTLILETTLEVGRIHNARTDAGGDL